MQTEGIQMAPGGYTGYNVGHPLSHKLHVKSSSYSYDGPQYDRSMLINGYPATRSTKFEVERPQSHGSPRLVISINTSFRNRYDKYSNPGHVRRRVPTFPALRTDLPSKRNRSAPIRPNSNINKRYVGPNSAINRRDPRTNSGNTRQDPSSSSASNRLSATLSSKDRRPSVNSRSDTKIDVNVTSNLSARQKSTFAMYAKYNDDNKNSVNERTNGSQNGKSDLNNITELTCTALTSAKPPPPLPFMSDEKQLRISNWIADTSKALRIEPVETTPTKHLPVIHEQ